jgi:hypothetical protein
MLVVEAEAALLLLLSLLAPLGQILTAWQCVPKGTRCTRRVLHIAFKE